MENQAPITVVIENKDCTTRIEGNALDGTLKNLILSLRDLQENCNEFLSSLVENNKGPGNQRSKHDNLFQVFSFQEAYFLCDTEVVEQKQTQVDPDDFDDEVYNSPAPLKRKSLLSQMPLKPKKIC